MVLPVRIELTTSPLPRECSTTELRQLWRAARGQGIHDGPRVRKARPASGEVGAQSAQYKANATQAESMEGPEFDRQYMADQVNVLQQALELFQTEAQNGQDPRLRAFAARALPGLARDLARAQAMAARMGA